MPSDPTAIADPLTLLLAWAGGLSGVGAFVAATKRVSRGFTWLVSGSTALIAIGPFLAGGAVWARASMLVLVFAVFASGSLTAALAMALAGVGFAMEASLVSGWLTSLAAAMALGGVTGEMLLGHWYLIDPRLPRWILRVLASVGIVGLLVDSALILSTGALPLSGPGWAFLLLAITSVLLMVSVTAALRYPAYSGVMAATGLSYLAVLTTLGAVFLGRALVAGLGPFVN